MQEPMDILKEFPVRKSQKQKQQFRDTLIPYAESLGYSVHVEKGSCGSRNIVIGNEKEADYLITAHYDTCAELPIPNFITPCSFWGFLGYQLLIVVLLFCFAGLISLAAGLLIPWEPAAFWGFELSIVFVIVMMFIGPANPSCVNDNTSGVITVLEIARGLPEAQRNRVCFILFDLEEAGLIGSASYAKAHKKEISHQINVNLDCVGDGDNIVFFPTGKLKKDREKLALFQKCVGYYGDKVMSVRWKGFSVYPSDQVNFPYGMGICALRKWKNILYLGRIHTRKDTILETTNVNLLRAAIISLVSCDAAK